MADSASSLLRRLERLKGSFGRAAANDKLGLLRQLSQRRLGSAKQVLGLHEWLCFARAYPDDPQVLSLVERMLATFADRSDLRRFRAALADTGIAGTAINYSFYWFTALWLARRWPDQLTVDWPRFEKRSRLQDILHLLLPYSETLAADELDVTSREWVELLKGPDESDAVFLIRRFAALSADSFGRETWFEDLDVPIRLAAGPDTPSRTQAKFSGASVVFQATPLLRARPALRREARRPPLAVCSVSPRTGQRLIDMAREAMVTRSRDLDIFVHADKRDVRLVDCGGGLQFACLGAVPERRLMLDAVYGLLTLKNGVPIGYVLVSALFNSAEVAYNVFETFRGGESAYVYGRILGLVRHLFGVDAFTVPPYQLGADNLEGLRSGAWWFYYKLGFRPHDAAVRRVLRQELARMKRNPRHRSSIATLKKLVEANVYWYLDRPRKDVRGMISLGNIGLRVSRYLAGRFGSDRERGIETCSHDAASLLGVRSQRGWSAGERLAWRRWSPLVMALPGVERWSSAEKRALARVVRAKGGRRESDFVLLFDRHRRLRRAVLALARSD
ncbi:MAG: hypothetical protein GTN62_12420 [Gemmatimonadales bacterium]|nr:hypothetical protein [Gemmatimonadales bacterium]NIN12530.1 hypothetical protein [Gemmatimonadales bacterium]NIN50901.1 hypothetical protein [Gemmatimonadales bacterium]NIP08365.1 hypothetical protein [Gemmatimonadales bacterium]NIR03462.1 hypothetical protein [Gemmatimonadales bacterium]